MVSLDFLLAICLALLHVFASRSAIFEHISHRRWVSFAGGVSIAYIFLDIFPEFSQAQAEIEATHFAVVGYLEHHVYLLALAGLAIFYGLEKLALRSRMQHQQETGKTHTQPSVFWIHTLSFAVYSALLGYLFREVANRGWLEFAFLFIALALHFIVIDVGLREHHQHVYDRIGRWILAGAIMLGWAIGQAFDFNAAAVSTVWAFIAGSLILNVLKEELPQEQESDFRFFMTGAVGYAEIGRAHV